MDPINMSPDSLLPSSDVEEGVPPFATDIEGRTAAVRYNVVRRRPEYPECVLSRLVSSG
jgi:hypothetical protein